ncbi:MAG TPA: GTP cyclohydrolase I, partial [Burkholderiales bacterium]|nr:GTP cyclohydrolase I [Burkholderiales bacterium]
MALNKRMLEENVMNGDAGYARNDQYNPETVRSIADKYRVILRELGEDPGREGLQKTPERVAKALQFLTHGYQLDPAKILRSA